MQKLPYFLSWVTRKWQLVPLRCAPGVVKTSV
jgi:hypothetical protein